LLFRKLRIAQIKEACVDHPYPWLKYLPAGELDGEDDTKFKGMKVESPSGEVLGKTEGFIVDSESGRPYYAVIDAGGWFKSKHFLLPVGHVRFDAGRNILVADATKDRVERFPGFELSKFDKMTADDIKRLNVETLQACTISGVVYAYSETEPYTAAWDRVDFSYPDWWSGQQPSERGVLPSGARGEVGSGRPYPPSVDRSPERERVVAKGSDVSPHFDGRAQPGDVLGVETDGEQTHVGDTADDENKRREAAQKEAEKLRGRER
jgi:hypothetical protein